MGSISLQLAALLAAGTVAAVVAATVDRPEPGPRPTIVRLPGNPIIRPEMLPAKDGQNINGPSLIRVPPWVEKPLGGYYLYFAHHGGKYIRLAYADRVEGPWKVYEPGTLKLVDAPWCKGHIASPDVIADDQRRELRMYFHGPAGGGQESFVALSKDGIHFTAREESLGIFYFRVFRWGEWWYGMAKGGQLYRSRDGLTAFEKGPNPLPGGDERGGSFNDGGPRHVAVEVEGDTLWVYYTSIGDAPERVFRCRVPLTKEWKEWRASEPIEVLRPETEWEGANLPLRKSAAGAAKGEESAVRDPAVFVEGGRRYLLYSIRGEKGIGVVELR